MKNVSYTAGLFFYLHLYLSVFVKERKCKYCGLENEEMGNREGKKTPNRKSLRSEICWVQEEERSKKSHTFVKTNRVRLQSSG